MRDNDLEIYITFTVDITVIRMIGRVMMPSMLTLSASIDRDEDAEDEAVELAILKGKHWLRNVVENTIIFDVGNTDAMNLLLDEDGTNKTDNMFVIAPDTPSDEMLAALFQAKLNALARGAINIVSMNIESDNMEGLSFTLCGDYSTTLPPTMDEWMGTPNYFQVPWWRRDDASTLDVVPNAEADLSTTPAWAYSLDYLGGSKVRPEMKDSVAPPGFRPTVIKGGKDPDDK